MTRRALARTLPLSLSLLAVAACGRAGGPEDSTGPTPSVVLGTPAEVRLRMGGSVQVGATSPLVVTFRDVEQDSRCPVDVQCAWAGDAAIALRLSRDGRSAGTTLHTGVEPRQVEYDGYVVRLLGVEPPTRAGREIPKSGYLVTLRVTRE